MKTKDLPCPYPGMYDAGRCCGGDCRTDADIIRATRNILTEWNFGSMTDRDALIRIHAFAGDNIQNAASRHPSKDRTMSEAEEKGGFQTGDQVEKFTGDYNIAGEVRAVFTAYEGGPARYVVRHQAAGGGWFCHIYAGSNLRFASALSDTEKTP